MRADLKGLRLTHPVHLLALGFGSGLSPKAPGTAGTLAAVPLYWLVADWPWQAYGLLLLAAALAGIWLCDRTARDLGVHDHPAIVWDEFVGFGITMLLAPAGWLWIGLGFVLFRLFDVLKPWPIGWCDRHVHGGLGIMLDDILAGILAWLSLQAIAWWVLP